MFQIFVSECLSVYNIFSRYVYFCLIRLYGADPLILITFIVEVCYIFLLSLSFFL